MKHVIHTPTADFAYVETEIEEAEKIIEPDIIESHNRLVSMIKGEVGLPAKEWAELRHRYFTGGAITPDEFYSLSPQQQFWVQETKKEIRSENK